MATSEVIKIKAGGYMMPVTLVYTDSRIEVNFNFNKILVDEFKNMSGAHWHGYDDERPRKIWSIANNQRNRFQLNYLQGKNPYAHYEQPLTPLPIIKRTRQGKEIDLYEHQKETVAFFLSRRQCIAAEEMGVGKTIAAIETMERSGVTDWWYVAPKGVIATIMRELRIWGSWMMPRLMTYDELRETMKKWRDGDTPPHGVIFDECQRIKTPTAQRSQAAKALADGIREHYGLEGYVILMSGTPAPKSPEDWWHLCEVACPGFLKEGDQHKFRKRLGLIVQKESQITGGVYPHLITWLNDENKCAICGKLKAEGPHDARMAVFNVDEFHEYKPSINEVAKLYRRMNGLVLVKMKKDCLDLPEKQYELVELKPNASTLRVAKAIAKVSPTVIQALTLLRELSDGFQYYDEKVGTETCPECNGLKIIRQPVPDHESCTRCKGVNYEECVDHVPTIFKDEEEVECPGCKGSGSVVKYERRVKVVDCPKDDLLRELLDRHEDVGRFIVYGGFEATIDKLVKGCLAKEWCVIREDGRGVIMLNADGSPINQSEIVGKTTGDKLLTLFQDMQEEYPKVVYVAQPESGGIGKTLTASPTAFYYSNSFNGEARSQSEDRHHRPGMDVNKGGWIIDCVHLPSDKKVLDNLKAKRNLELMSMGELTEAMSAVAERD
jgi:hypothetical protein